MVLELIQQLSPLLLNWYTEIAKNNYRPMYPLVTLRCFTIWRKHDLKQNWVQSKYIHTQMPHLKHCYLVKINWKRTPPSMIPPNSTILPQIPQTKQTSGRSCYYMPLQTPIHLYSSVFLDWTAASLSPFTRSSHVTKCHFRAGARLFPVFYFDDHLPGERTGGEECGMLLCLKPLVAVEN